MQLVVTEVKKPRDFAFLRNETRSGLSNGSPPVKSTKEHPAFFASSKFEKTSARLASFLGRSFQIEQNEQRALHRFVTK